MRQSMAALLGERVAAEAESASSETPEKHRARSSACNWKLVPNQNCEGSSHQPRVTAHR